MGWSPRPIQAGDQAPRQRLVAVLIFLAAILFVQRLLGQFAAAAQVSPAREIADTLVGLVRASLVVVLIAVLIAVAIAGALVAFGAYLAGRPEWLVRRLPTVAGAGRAEPAEPPSRGA
jgi:small-conductance mechanosensitive channel